MGVEDRPGIAYKVFSLLGQQNINVDIILQSIGRDESQDISFTVRRSDVDQALALLEAHKSSLAFDHIDVDKSVVKVSIVGAGMVDNAGVAAKMFGALYDADINIHMISTSEIKVSVLLDVLFLLTILSVAPSIVLTITSFTRIIIVFSFLRQAMGVQQLPPTQVLASLAIFLTVVIMFPVGKRINDEGKTVRVCKTCGKDID